MIYDIELVDNSTIVVDITVVSKPIYFIVIYSFIFILSLLGNTFILLIVYKSKRIRVTNNYFLANISLANLIYTVFAPFPFLAELHSADGNAWIFFDFMCPIIPFLNTLAINLNTLTMIVFSIDRLFSILRPFRPRLAKSRLKFIILAIWLVSALFSLPWLGLVGVQEKNSYFEDNLEYKSDGLETEKMLDYEFNSIKFCVPWPKYEKIINHYFLVLCVLQYFVPLIILCCSFVAIAFYIKVVNVKRISSDANKLNANLRKKNEKKVNN